ncbi:MAG: substrate-binding domain-containing protein [Cyanobacteriota bacterium]|nr:substrate-binding domain-containing protein [Cyanobacteriota bacterium]
MMIMQHHLRQTLVVFMLGAIALVGTSSCSTQTTTSPAPTATTLTNNTETSPIKTGGSSSTVDFLQTLKTAYKSTSKTGKITLLEPGQSENAIAGVKQGLIDIGGISREIKPEENDNTLNFRKAAQDALVVATHPRVTGVTNLTTEQLKGIYSGSITNWKQLGGPDTEILLLDRPEDESAKRLLREHYLGQDLPNSPNAVVLRKEGELIQTLESTPNSIGAFSLAYAISHNLPVNRLQLNGVAPTLENLKTGKYPMARTIGIVWSKNASEATQAFVNYILSQPGASALEQSGFAPIAQTTEPERK